MTDVEVLIPVNQYNWMDCSIANIANIGNDSDENAYISAQARSLLFQLVVPFNDFHEESVDFQMLFKVYLIYTFFC